MVSPLSALHVGAPSPHHHRRPRRPAPTSSPGSATRRSFRHHKHLPRRQATSRPTDTDGSTTPADRRDIHCPRAPDLIPQTLEPSIPSSITPPPCQLCMSAHPARITTAGLVDQHPPHHQALLRDAASAITSTCLVDKQPAGLLTPTVRLPWQIAETFIAYEHQT
jgi:hypothetical protein